MTHLNFGVSKLATLTLKMAHCSWVSIMRNLQMFLERYATTDRLKSEKYITVRSKFPSHCLRFITYLINMSHNIPRFRSISNIMVSQTDSQSTQKIGHISKFHTVCSGNDITIGDQSPSAKMISWQLQRYHPRIFTYFRFSSVDDFW